MTTEPTITIEEWCYIDVGGTYCYSPNDPRIEQAAQWQAEYLAAIGVVVDDPYAPWSIQFSEIPDPAYTTTTTTLPTECFQEPGGNYCYVIGSPEWEEARGEFTVAPPIPTTIPVPPVIVATTTTTVPAVTSEYSPADRGEQEVAVVEEPTQEPPAVVAVVEVPVAPAPVQQLPETGMESAILLAGVACVALGSWLHGFRRRML